MKEIVAYLKYIVLVKMSLFSVCESSGYHQILSSSSSLFPVTTNSHLSLMLSLSLLHFVGSYPSLAEGNFDMSEKAKVADTGDATITKITKVSGSTSTSTLKPNQKGPKEKTLFIPDRTPANYTFPPHQELDSGEDDEDGDATGTTASSFNLKAVERTLVVITGIAVIILSYIGIKFFLKARKFGGRYGIVASEMELLDKMEEDEEESEEEEELFDINSHRRRPF